LGTHVRRNCLQFEGFQDMSGSRDPPELLLSKRDAGEVERPPIPSRPRPKKSSEAAAVQPLTVPHRISNRRPRPAWRGELIYIT
jgi:hypothetical protein